MKTSGTGSLLCQPLFSGWGGQDRRTLHEEEGLRARTWAGISAAPGTMRKAVMAHRERIDISIWRIEAGNDHLAGEAVSALRCRCGGMKSPHLTAAGVPLRNIATKRSALDSLSISPPVTMAWQIRMPTTGNMAIFTSVTATMAIIGRRERGRGMRSRANEAPSMTSARGTAMLPKKLAAGGARRRGRHQRLARKTPSSTWCVRTCVNNEGQWRLSVRALPVRPPCARDIDKEGFQGLYQSNGQRDDHCNGHGMEQRCQRAQGPRQHSWQAEPSMTRRRNCGRRAFRI